MLTHAPKTLTGQRDRAILALGFAGALRRAELAALNVEDLVEVADGFRVLPVRKPSSGLIPSSTYFRRSPRGRLGRGRLCLQIQAESKPEHGDQAAAAVLHTGPSASMPSGTLWTVFEVRQSFGKGQASRQENLGNTRAISLFHLLFCLFRARQLR